MGFNAASDHDLIESLYAISKKDKKLVHPNQQTSPVHPDVTLTSWKMNEWKYYDVPSPFPTLARGLFTTTENKRHRIVVRGYDKFFNIGEVPWNTWEALEHHTAPPYTLTLKSNGCIIFIAAIYPEKVIVTSKHSLTSEHAKVGLEWLEKIVTGRGYTMEQFAATLWEKKWTAIAELCDDSFEEHVLPYSKENTGLHLHGLNHNTKDFVTELPEVVDEFAREWGFIVTKSLVLNTIPEVKKFTDEINEAKEWNGEALEGFVVRTHVTEPPTKKGVSQGKSPYAAGSSYFFKVKFDEPYMMYRDWRELTKACIMQHQKSGGHITPHSLPKKRMQRPETRVYVDWVVKEIKRDPRQFDGYTANHGIIATRERFLKWLAENKGNTEAKTVPSLPEAGSSSKAEKTFGKTVIVPIAIPGCGKTAVAVALSHLFGFGHTQSDDVKAKKPAPIFLRNVSDLLRSHDVVIADKNNHLRQHRQGLRDQVKHLKPPVRLLALHWTIDKPPAIIHRLMSDRIVARGTNHQSLLPDTSTSLSHEAVLWMFLKNSEELGGDEVDVVVEMDLEAAQEQQLRTAVDACVRELGVTRPSDEKIREALAVAADYKPKSTKAPENRSKDRQSKPPRYFGLLPELDIGKTLESIIPNSDNSPKDFWAKLKQHDRVAKQPHITIVHKNSLPDQQELWDACTSVQAIATPPVFSFRLSYLLWNDRVMALVVEDPAVSSDHPDPDASGVGVLLKIPQKTREHLHITVGTASESIQPVEAKSLVEAWRHGKKDKIGIMPLSNLWAHGRLKGMFS